MKAKNDKLDINTLNYNVPNSLNNIKTKVDNLDVGKLKTVPVDMKKLSDAVDNEAVKNTKFNTLKAKVNNLERKTFDSTSLIHINQYNTDKQNLDKKNWRCWQKIPDTSGSVTTTVLKTEINEFENKIPDNSKYNTTEVFNKLTAENIEARLKQANLVNKLILIIN